MEFDDGSARADILRRIYAPGSVGLHFYPRDTIDSEKHPSSSVMFVFPCSHGRLNFTSLLRPGFISHGERNTEIDTCIFFVA